MTTGGRRLLTLRERSRLGEESRDEGLDERECEDMGLVWSPPGMSSMAIKVQIYYKRLIISAMSTLLY